MINPFSRLNLKAANYLKVLSRQRPAAGDTSSTLRQSLADKVSTSLGRALIYAVAGATLSALAAKSTVERITRSTVTLTWPLRLIGSLIDLALIVAVLIPFVALLMVLTLIALFIEVANTYEPPPGA